MKYLLDTHTFLWFINGDSTLSTKARKCIEDNNTIKYISIVSFWEISIKIRLGKLFLDMPFSQLKDHIINNRFDILPITFEHTSLLVELNLAHKDPFDRMIISQAITENLSIIGKDKSFSQYDVRIIW